VYIRPEVVGPFSGPCASGSYVHQASLLYITCAAQLSIAHHYIIFIKLPFA
jgi:hypothetical protein